MTERHDQFLWSCRGQVEGSCPDRQRLSSSKGQTPRKRGTQSFGPWAETPVAAELPKGWPGAKAPSIPRLAAKGFRSRSYDPGPGYSPGTPKLDPVTPPYSGFGAAHRAHAAEVFFC